MQLTTEEEDHHKKVKQLREHIKEKEDVYKQEKATLLKQIDASMKLKQAAEKEADDALAQLEAFVAEHGEMVCDTSDLPLVLYTTEDIHDIQESVEN